MSIEVVVAVIGFDLQYVKVCF
jgi:hypothetical protein